MLIYEHKDWRSGELFKPEEEWSRRFVASISAVLVLGGGLSISPATAATQPPQQLGPSLQTAAAPDEELKPGEQATFAELLHLGIGRTHARTEIICLIHDNDATVITQATGELLAEFTLNPDKNYQRKND